MIMKKKILYLAVGDEYGSGKALKNIILGTRNNGMECRVAIAENLGLKESLKNEDIFCYSLPLRFEIYPKCSSVVDQCLFFPRFLRDKIINLKAYNKLKTIVKEYKPDIIHTNVGVYRVGYRVAKEQRIPHVWHIREYQIEDMGYKIIGGREKLIKLLKSPGNYPVAITKGIYDAYKMESPATLIYDGVRSVTDIYMCETKKKYFLFVGNISKHKGVEELILAFAIFAKRNSDYNLHIAGNYLNDYGLRMQQLVLEKNLQNRIRFLGYCNNIDELMQEAYALIVPSYFEGFGLITAEAMYNGCLVIGRNSAGTKEQLDNGVAFTKDEIGLRFDDVDSLSEKMLLVADRIDRFYPMINKAQYTASTLYNIELSVEKIQELYNKI